MKTEICPEGSFLNEFSRLQKSLRLQEKFAPSHSWHLAPFAMLAPRREIGAYTSLKNSRQRRGKCSGHRVRL
jgi:hypothetical protein